MNGELADLWLTDPPYNVDYVGKTKDALKVANDSMSDSAFRQFLVDAFKNAFDSMKPGASFYIWHADSEGYNFRGAVQDCGQRVRQCLIWNKNSMVLGRQDYNWKHEPCLVGWKEGAAHSWFSDCKQTTVLDFNRPTRSEAHPTMKPAAMFVYLMTNSSPRGSIVLDTFAGSGIVSQEFMPVVCYKISMILSDNIETLGAIVHAIRTTIVSHKPWQEFPWLTRFPHNCCDLSSWLLSVYFYGLGYREFSIVNATLAANDQVSHVWIEGSGVVVDMTLDQFDSTYLGVIVSMNSNWHVSQSIRSRLLFDNSEYKKWALDPCNTLIRDSLAAILEKMPSNDGDHELRFR